MPARLTCWCERSRLRPVRKHTLRIGKSAAGSLLVHRNPEEALAGGDPGRLAADGDRWKDGLPNIRVHDTEQVARIDPLAEDRDAAGPAAYGDEIADLVRRRSD